MILISKLKYRSIQILFLSLLSFHLTGQTPETSDTSYFTPWDDNYNLLIAVNKADFNSINLLLNRGASVNASTVDGVTPLMYASENGNLELVRLLIERGADINKKPVNGATALIVAAKQNFYDIAETLIGNKAELDIRDSDGITAVNYAAAFNNFDVMDMLIYYGADMEIPDNDGNTPLISAAFNNAIEAADLLLQNGALIDAVDQNGYTALMTAIQRNNFDMAYLLIDKGANIHLLNKGGYSALAYSVSASNMELSEALIDMGADINQKTETGYSILEIARYEKADDIVDLLQTNDAKYNLNPHFNTLSLGPYLDFNFTDYMNGFQVSLLDGKYGIGINSGFGFRPFANRVLYKFDETLTYQYWERRYYFYAGIDKKFDFISAYNAATGPFLGFSEVYTFGSFRGSEKNPPKKFITAPYIGWYYSTNYFKTWFAYQYLDYKTPEIKPGRFNLGINVNINLIKRSLTSKNINWLQ